MEEEKMVVDQKNAGGGGVDLLTQKDLDEFTATKTARLMLAILGAVFLLGLLIWIFTITSSGYFIAGFVNFVFLIFYIAMIIMQLKFAKHSRRSKMYGIVSLICTGVYLVYYILGMIYYPQVFTAVGIDKRYNSFVGAYSGGGDFEYFFQLYDTFAYFTVIPPILGVIQIAEFVNFATGKNKIVEKILVEADIARGTKYRVNLLRKLMAMTDLDEFKAALTAEHEFYLSIADIALTPAEADELILRLSNIAGVVDGKASRKDMLARAKSLYKVRNYAELRKLDEEYTPRFEEYKLKRFGTVEKPAYTVEFEGKGGFDGWLIQKIGWDLLCGLVNTVTLGIAYPFTVCWKRRWYCKHTVYDGKRLSFDGNGMQLWGKYLLWLLLTVVTFGIYGFFLNIRMEKWLAKHTHVKGEFKEYGGTFDGWLIQYIGWSLLCGFVSVITLGIAVPFTICWMERWYCKHRIYDGKRLSFDGKGIQLLGKWILWMFLTAITFGIFAFFIGIRIEKWKAKHTHLSQFDECVAID